MGVDVYAAFAAGVGVGMVIEFCLAYYFWFRPTQRFLRRYRV